MIRLPSVTPDRGGSSLLSNAKDADWTRKSVFHLDESGPVVATGVLKKTIRVPSADEFKCIQARYYKVIGDLVYLANRQGMSLKRL